MTSRLIPLAGLAVVALGVLGLLFWKEAGPGESPPKPGRAVPAGPEEVAEEAPGMGGDVPAREPIRSTPFVPPEAEEPGADRSLATPRPRARIRGRVLASSGKPLPGVPVSLLLERLSREGSSDVEQVDRPALTDASGRFLFTGISPGCRATVRGRPTRHCDVRRVAEITAPGEVDLGDLVAAEGGGLGGTVMSAGGHPLEGAEVTAMPAGDASSPLRPLLLGVLSDADAPGRSARTDAQGAWRIEGLEARHWVLVARAAGYLPASRGPVEVKVGALATSQDFELTGGKTLEGYVEDRAGVPVPGAAVSLVPSVVALDSGNLDQTGLLTTQSGPDGRFCFEGLRDEPHNVNASREGYIPAGQGSVRPGEEVVLVLEPCGLIHGRVVRSPELSGIDHFEMVPTRSGRLGTMQTARAMVLQGAAAAERLGVPEEPGLFVVTDLPAGQVFLEVKAPGFARMVAGPFQVSPGSRETAEVALLPEIVVSGTVTDPDGRPLAGATVVLRRGGEVAETDVPARRVIRRHVSVPRPGDADTLRPLLDGEAVVTAESGAEGFFRLGGLGPGDYRLEAEHRQHARSQSLALHLREGRHEEGILVTLRPGGTLAGRALDEGGKPLAGATVKARPAPGEEQAQPYSAISESSGRFSIAGMRPGRYYVRVEESAPHAGVTVRTISEDGALGPESDEVMVEVAAGLTTEVELRLPPKARVHGMVTEAGQPAPRLRVTLLPAGALIPLGAPAMDTDRQGWFSFEDVTLGEYTLSAHPPGAARPVRLAIQVTGAGEHRFDLVLPTGSIEGRVMDEVSGEPVAGVELGLRTVRETEEVPATRTGVMIAVRGGDPGGGAVTQTFSLGDAGPEPVRTDERGFYRLRYLHEDEYEVSVEGQGFIPERRKPVRVVEGLTTRDVDFAVRKGATLVVHADTLGVELPFFVARLRRAGDPAPLVTKGGDPHQPLRLEGLEPGRYQLELESMMNEYVGSVQVEVPPQGVLPVTVPLRPVR